MSFVKRIFNESTIPRAHSMDVYTHLVTGGGSLRSPVGRLTYAGVHGTQTYFSDTRHKSIVPHTSEIHIQKSDWSEKHGSHFIGVVHSGSHKGRPVIMKLASGDHPDSEWEKEF